MDLNVDKGGGLGSEEELFKRKKDNGQFSVNLHNFSNKSHQSVWHIIQTVTNFGQ